ncbi:MAG TPA: hypothetical protein VN421_01980 [Pseudoflavonifractor sp.]|nr:hypothetical protein [Pseudoflavonifractor sp.]
MYTYLPSCNFTAACPEASRKIQRYLNEKTDVRVAGCCRPAQVRLTGEDTVLTLCLACSAITREVSPQAGEMSIWAYLLEDAAFPWPDYGGEPMVLQDCWRARNKPELLSAVRRCMARMNITPVELLEHREKTEFDGVWRFNPMPQRNLDIAPVYFGEVRDHGLELIPEEVQKLRMEEWAKQYTTDRVVTYCPACLNGVRLGGANGVHLMELATCAME